MALETCSYNVRFLPSDGFIFVDTCGPKWVPDRCGRRASVSKLMRFNRLFEKRGELLVTPMVFNEILADRDYYFKYMVDTEKMLQKRVSGGVKAKGLSRFFENLMISFEGMCANVKLAQLLEVVDIDNDSVNGGLNYSEIRDFYQWFQIQESDKELISAATFYGSGNGVLTADKPLMKAYRKGLRRFSLDGFICDSTRSEIEWVGRKKVYNCG